MQPLARLEDVVHFYGAEQALGPLTLDIPRESTGLLGPNGSGKSTLIRLLVGLLRPTSGEITLLGEAPGPATHRLVGYVPEGEARFPEQTGVRSVAYAGRLVGMPASDALQRAHQVLDYVGLSEERYRPVSTYSTGMRQRLKLAQALVHDPEVLVLDEPTEGVDPQARVQLLDLLDELQREHGLTLLISTHLLADVERLAERVVVLDQGRLAVDGSVEELRAVESSAHLVKVVGTDEAQGAFTQALDAAGVDWAEQHPYVRIGSGAPLEILAWADEAGVVVRHIAPVQRGLDEALLSALEQPRTAAGAPSEAAASAGGEPSA